MVRNIEVLGGSYHPRLTAQICRYLGIKNSDTLLSKFSSGETRVEVKTSVRGKDIFIIQSSDSDVNDSLLELLITISACRIASAKRIVAVLPLFPYSKQKDSPYERGYVPPPRAPNGIKLPIDGLLTNEISTPPVPEDIHISPDPFRTVPNSPQFHTNLHSNSGNWQAKPGTLVANLLTCAGADHIVTMDLHNAQYQGFFNIPVENLYVRPLLRNYIQHQVPSYRDIVIVSPDAGGAKRATSVADELGLDFALIHKVAQRMTGLSRTPYPSPPSSPMSPLSMDMILVGDVQDRTVVLIDDLADTCETITRAARLLKSKGASRVYAIVTHGIFSGDAIAMVSACDALDHLVVTNTIPQTEHCQQCSKIEVLEVDELLAEAIRRIHYGESMDVLTS